MILETVRIIADWLNDGTYGVNAVRTNVPKDVGVTDFPAVQIFDSTRDGRIGRGGIPQMLPSELPALLVTPADSPVEQNGAVIRSWPPDAKVTVLVRYVAREMDTAKAERDASQTIRAIWRSIGSMVTQRTGTQRASGVHLISVVSMQAATLYESTEDTTVTGGVIVMCHVRDTWAQAS